ncbi:MAG TPA: thioredoxin [Patescibacteria group bacterium]|nr:thioredoxin [Patescibacteria group bacterium]
MAEIVITDQNFQKEVTESQLPVLVDFWAPWCGPCKIISPIIEELATEFAGKIKVGKLNVDENPETAGKFGVMSIPTLLFFKSGQPVDSIVGAQSKDAIKQKMAKLLQP